MAKKCSKIYTLLYTIYGKTKKGNTNSTASCQSVSSVLKTDYIPLNLVKWRKKLVVQNNSSGSGSPFMVTVCLENVSWGLTAPHSVSEEFTQEEHSP